MNKQRKVLITITYNEVGIIIDTKAEELDSSAQPTVEERKTGKWITKQTNGDWFDVCSECGHVEWMTPGRYCPNCGAKMEGNNG